MQYASRKDIEDLLELLSTTRDIEVQSKIFSLFSCYLVSRNSTHKDLIITSHYVYDGIYGILSCGLPKKVTIALNFVSALVFEAEDEACTTKQTLVLHARNMMRVSGCLAIMSNIFNSCMVHHETWTALCRCLSEVCSHSRENQSYCSDLITTGIRRCTAGDTESYQVLQSLLHKHDQNTQQFIESNGFTILTRDKLHNASCLKLVNVIAQNSKAVILLVNKTEVIEILRDFLNLYGKESTIGQWATLILYNIKTLFKELDKQETKVNFDLHYYFNNDNTIHKQISFKDFDKEPKETKANAAYRFCVNNETITNYMTHHDDTTELFQNVFRELKRSQRYDVNIAATARSENSIRQNIKSKAISNLMKPPYSSSVKKMRTCFRTERPNLSVRSPNRVIKHLGISPKKLRHDLSFSFLQNDSFSFNKNPKYRNQQQIISLISSHTEKPFLVTNTSVNIKQDMQVNNETKKNIYNSNITKYEEIIKQNDEDFTIEFMPTIVSTPKRTKQQFRNSREIIKEERQNGLDSIKHQRSSMKVVKNKSFSGRFFSAINDSCTMFVKTVKNIFTTKNIDEDTDQTTKDDQSAAINVNTKKAHSNYSFMHYMQRRDAMMHNQCGELSTKKSASLCETCNDTELLKRKLEKDYKLKQTVKKLKFGINLYGCDFKKISSSMWPRDSYMTPTVLYNLYRKLIVK
ncbi:uncharacterized protein LOC106136906 [Amyelois transitella]|uniref:uncharacterized protein LOC106136906 n=1 Tax=Amyelois transitella TaxID=680683 RepID=UPI00298FBE63|nr:uncharacterized protein LOC106136906 [Amyelois transitella]